MLSIVSIPYAPALLSRYDQVPIAMLSFCTVQAILFRRSKWQGEVCIAFDRYVVVVPFKMLTGFHFHQGSHFYIELFRVSFGSLERRY